MEYVLQDCNVVDILVRAQSSGGNSIITLHAKLTHAVLCNKLIMHKMNL